MYGVSMPSVDALAQDFLTTAVPSWMTVTRGAGSWSRQTGPALNGTTFIELGTAQNTGRFDYADSVGRSMLLIEPTRTNIEPDSNFVDAGANDIPDGWVANAGAGGVDFNCAAGGPHGGLLFRLEDTATAARGCYDVIASPGAVTLVGSGLYRRTVTAGAASMAAFYDNVGLAWTTLSLGTALCDWTLFQTAPVAVGGCVDGGLLFAAVGTDPPGVTESILPQLEVGDCATSRIPSAGGQATRAAELCAIDASVIGRTSGLVQFLWRPDYASTAALTVDPVLFEWAPGWELMYDVSEDKLSIVVNSVTRAASSALTWARGDLLRLSVRYSSAGQQLIVEQAGGVIDIAEDATSWADPGALAPYMGSRAASVNCRPSAFGSFLSTAL